MSSDQKNYKIFRCINYQLQEDEIEERYEGEILENIPNDLYYANIILESIYKNCKIYYEDIDKNPIIPVGKLFIKSKVDNIDYFINWMVKDKDNKIIYNGYFIS